MSTADPNHYATLGLDHRCTAAQIRAAYRALAKRHHPDRNPDAPAAVARAQELNAAYEILRDPARRRAYDRDIGVDDPAPPAPARVAKRDLNISQDANLRIEDFFRGATLEVRVHDPGHPHGPETYALTIPPDTAPGTRFKLPRAAPFEGGCVQVRVKAQSGFRFKARGSDLRCDLRISTARAEKGGTEMIPGPAGAMLRVAIPAGVARGEILRLPGEGLPKLRGGRGELLVRITYRPEVRIIRR